MKSEHKRVLVLNADFTPFSTISWRRAIVLSMINQQDSTRGVSVVEYYNNDSIQATCGKKYAIPAVVRMSTYTKHRKRSIPFSRKNVFLRDQMTCMYCGKQFEPNKLTYDHVIPRSIWKKMGYSGSPTKYENIVTACVYCNRKKANKTPKQAKMTLLKEPKSPNPSLFILGLSPWSKIPQEWTPYLTPLYKHLNVKV